MGINNDERSIMKFIIWFILLGLIGTTTTAQQNNNAGVKIENGPPICDQATAGSSERTVPITISHSLEGQISSPQQVVHMGDWLSVSIPTDKFTHFQVQGNITPTPILYLNHIAITGLEWMPGGCNRIPFHLTRTSESRGVIGLLLKHAGSPITVGVGTVQEGFITDVGQIKLELASDTARIGWSLGILGFICGTIFLAWKTDLLRDLSNAPSKDEQAPYSLARVQMAWWFILTVFAFSGIWIITGDLSSIPSSILALMGISSATTIMSAVLDATSSINPQKSKGLLIDILTDDGKISFHRFQMLVWTVLLGGIFINQVWSTLSMPDFDSQLLGLMGVASGTYLGFKIPAANK